MGLETGRLAFRLRRLSGLVLVAYLLSWAVALPSQPTRAFLGDLRTWGTPGLVLELVLIAVIAGHAFDGIAQIWISRARAARRHRVAFTVVATLTLVVALIHVPVLWGWL